MTALPGALRWSVETLDGERCLRLDFHLPGGVYATSLLREIMKNDALADVAFPAEAPALPAGAAPPAGLRP